MVRQVLVVISGVFSGVWPVIYKVLSVISGLLSGVLPVMCKVLVVIIVSHKSAICKRLFARIGNDHTSFH